MIQELIDYMTNLWLLKWLRSLLGDDLLKIDVP